jgi:hypothetical protein
MRTGGSGGIDGGREVSSVAYPKGGACHVEQAVHVEQAMLNCHVAMNCHVEQAVHVA